MTADVRIRAWWVAASGLLFGASVYLMLVILTVRPRTLGDLTVGAPEQM
ncbi:Uncharacterised protein [Mycobacteroides abscessus subsp. abscessus]|nr:Uncharacterised protein [Mycobacteroides abscessus subsp. abscessus]